MVEVFKTDVQNKQHATLLIALIHKTCVDCTATFDLEDCDKILRVQCNTGGIQASTIINTLRQHGYYAAVLQDEMLPI